MKQIAVQKDVWAPLTVPSAPATAQNVQWLVRDSLGRPIQGRYLGLTCRVIWPPRQTFALDIENQGQKSVLKVANFQLKFRFSFCSKIKL